MSDELRSYGPGKFTLVIDDYVHRLTCLAGSVEDLGDVEGFGFYALANYAVDDIQSVMYAETEALTEAEVDFLRSHPWAILNENSEGFVTVAYFETEETARTRWVDIEAECATFEESAEDETDEDLGFLTTFDAQRIASDWHGGQWSAMYSFSSSGHVDKQGLLNEIDADLKTCADEKERKRLTSLRAWVEGAEDDEPEPNEDESEDPE